MEGNRAQIDRLYRKIRQGKAVLFLGAGASMTASAPSGKQLSEEIQKEFLGKANSIDDVIETCSKVLDTPGINRSDLEDFIRAKLNVQPSASHMALTNFRWQAVFTTNFDDLIELAYRISKDPIQNRCEVIFDNRYSRTESDYLEVVRVFKLMGCIHGNDRNSRMALTRADYNRKIQQRDGLFRSLKDFSKDGTIIYVGYGFGDYIARDIIDEIRDEYPHDELPWSWAVLSSCDERTEQVLRERRILPLRINFEDFIKEIKSSPDDSQTPTEAGCRTVTVKGIPVEIPIGDWRMYDQHFEFLHDEIGDEEIIDELDEKRRFLEGGSHIWTGIRRNWVFRRHACKPLFLTLTKCLESSSHDVPTILLKGPAGSGKTLTSRTVAHDVYNKEGIPCLFLNPNKEKLDYKVIDSFWRQLATHYRRQGPANEPISILIVLDEAAARFQDVRRLPQFLRSRGIPATILAISRENEWVQAIGREGPLLQDTQIIPDKFDSHTEASELINHLINIKILPATHDIDYWVSRIRRDYENSFWNTLYHLVEPTRPPLLKAVKDEYDNLLDIAKRAYSYICLFYRFGIPLDLELLARALDCSYEVFVNSVYSPASKGVIYEDDKYTSVDITRFRARTRLIAECVIDYRYPSSMDWLADLEYVATKLLPQNRNEVETIQNLLVRRLGPNGTHRIDRLSDLMPVFKAVTEASGVVDSTILHHIALLLMEEREFEKAEKYAQWALDVLRDPDAQIHFKTESPQNVYNTLGMIAARKGLYHDKNGELKNAEASFKAAVEFFGNARSGEFPNAYPYYGEAWMYRQQASYASGSDKLVLLAKSLEILDESVGNVDQDGESALRELEAKLISDLSSNEIFKLYIKDLRTKNMSTARYLEARAATYQHGEYSLDSAYKMLQDALEKTPDHIPCLRLVSQLHRQIHPHDWKGWFDILRHRFLLEDVTGQCGLLFGLAHACCQMGNFQEASKYFQDLDSESSGHPRRSGIIEILRDDSNTPKIFGADITRLTARNDGWLNSSEIGFEVKFIPLAQKFTVQKGQTVNFELALNYRGLLAVNLRPT